MKRFLVPLLVLAAGLLVAGTTELTEREISDARKLYHAKCARCHKFYHPAEYTEKDWHAWMDKMSRKARLKPDQKDLLSRYLETFRNPDPNRTNAPPIPK